VLLSLADLGSNRMNRTLLVMAGLVIYASFCLGLVRYGYLQVAGSAFVLLLGVWIVGLLALMFADESNDRFDAGALTYSKALWCNLGVVATAVLIPHTLRLLLLVVPLLGLLYAALHLDRKQTFSIGVVTWVSYLACALALTGLSQADPVFEGLMGLAFTCMLAAMMVMASEVTALRVAFERRRERLNEAMEQLAELAMRDELTGLYNRRYIMDVLARQKALADRGHVSFTLCYCDLDHFKQINDRYGHQVGDRVLNEFSRIAESVVRSMDFVARLGGEEFLLVLVGADEGIAQGVAERLCERTKLLEIDAEAVDLRLSVSVGIASFRMGERIEDVIQRSDQALYAAKSQGRDRIVVGC
jgi:diguanylate cyclase (GGDEF)-like protein